jgi:hypothetical protein
MLKRKRSSHVNLTIFPQKQVTAISNYNSGALQSPQSVVKYEAYLFPIQQMVFIFKQFAMHMLVCLFVSGGDFFSDVSCRDYVRQRFVSQRHAREIRRIDSDQRQH